jgi:type 1 fimbria pilin
MIGDFISQHKLGIGMVVMSLLPLSVQAVDSSMANLKITGTVLAESCDVAASSKNQTVNLGDVNANTFNGVGDTSASKPLNIELTGCSDSIKGTTVTFSGTADSKDSTLVALSDTSGVGSKGMATGVGVQIQDAATQAVLPLNKVAPLHSLSVGDNTLRYLLRYKSTAATVTAGNANAVLYYTLDYQ